MNVSKFCPTVATNACIEPNATESGKDGVEKLEVIY